MRVLFYVLCVTFFLSLFILKFKWFKKIGEFLARPFIKLMKKRRSKKKGKEAVASEKNDRLGKSDLQIRPVVLPPQLNAPKNNQEKNDAIKEPMEENVQEKKPLTMKDAFGDADPFATRPIFSKSQENFANEDKYNSHFGTKFAQNMPNSSPKKQDRVSLDFLSYPVKNSSGVTYGQQNLNFKKTMENFGQQNSIANSRKNFAQGQRVNSFGFSVDERKPWEKSQNFLRGAGNKNLSNSDRANAKISMQNFDSASSMKRTPEMEAIISKRQREFENYKRQRDNLNIDGQDVDVAGIPPKLKRILVMGILDKKDFD